jgi:DNA-binding XRE family transcriptional regulator
MGQVCHVGAVDRFGTARLRSLELQKARIPNWIVQPHLLPGEQVEGTFDELMAKVSASWTPADWEHYRLIAMAMRLEVQRIRLGHLVKQARKELGYSQRQLAKLTGIQQKEICKIEKQKGNPTLTTLHKLFEVLGIQARYEIVRSEPITKEAA